MKESELKICGLPAVRARFSRDPGSIQRLYFDYETGRRVGAMSRALAEAKKIYRCVESAELEKIAGTLHHGGIVAVVSTPVLRAPAATDLRSWAAARVPVLILDRIGNAHNLGAIARSAGFFGIARLVLPADPAAAVPSDAAYRVAEGGLEMVEIYRVADLVAFIRELTSAGYDVVGAATRGGRSPAAIRKGRRGHSVAPCALVLGNEEHGLAPDVAAACSQLVTLPARGKVESLNVSVAAAVLMWELLARNP